MERLETITVRDGSKDRTIELAAGDLMDLAPPDRVDVLIISAFPDDYTPTPGSLIGALAARGISVGELARDKAVDLHPTSSCWMSHEILAKPGGLALKRILCFEPRERRRASDAARRQPSEKSSVRSCLSRRPMVRTSRSRCPL